ncbi:lysylphosphatidylglycerol synthase domain-containing protein [uncultured Roseobacter sp.]|uniref:lysylphosphatidylglycerol synthase domain-containing protein n=1 Tax=uncultured Roseobacter sp. TaxID=114847 RepID=UPI00260F9C87|nr:lysylphosphatidylglycerol synthase domain-containing protein [uncultured Roseobacter sp.]
MQTSETAKSRSSGVVKWIGRALTLAALAFIAWEVRRQWPALSQWQPTALDLTRTLVQSMLYGASLYMLAGNWQIILDKLSGGAMPVRLGLFSYTSTQIAKYIPGNVAHLIGRYLVLRGKGLSDKALGLATLMELLSMPLAAVLTASLFVTLMPLDPAIWFAPLANFAAPFVLGAGVLAGLAVFVIPAHLPWISHGRRLCLVVLIACLFMGILGLNLWAILYFMIPNPSFAVIPATIIAWLVGYLTPGSPGGIGTREATILLLLEGVAPDSTLLLSVLIFRIVTVSGDFFCYVSGQVLLRPTAA